MTPHPRPSDGQPPPALSERQIEVLSVLHREMAQMSAGLIGNRMQRPRPSNASIAGTLRGLRTRGFVVKHFRNGWNGDLWEITEAGREAVLR